MERKNLSPTLLDGMAADLGGRKAEAFFKRCDELVPWNDLAKVCASVFKESPEGGRPHWPLVLLVKCLMLQKWFGLSDPGLEEMLLDRLSFRRFVGLSLNDAVPDETTICNFRNALVRQQLIAPLFEKAKAHLERHGLVLHEGTLVDATIVEAPLGTKRADGSSTADPCATKTYKHSRSYHGYKAHIATDTRGMITDYIMDTASPHDSVHADELMAKETRSVWADSAYMSEPRKQALEERGVFAGIIWRRVKGQKQLRPEQVMHNQRVAAIRAMVEHPFAWMAKMGYSRARYRGLTNNAVDFGLMAIAYNFKRAMSLVCLL